MATLKKFSPISFLVGAVLGVLLTLGWFLTPAAWFASGAAGGKAALPPSTQSGAVSVADQSAGDSVTVDSVTVPPPGVWVAVRDVDESGRLGNVLGAARAGAPRSNFVVPLLRATESNTSYAVELYRDNGDNQFDLSTDSVYVDFDTGARVVEYFKTLP